MNLVKFNRHSNLSPFNNLFDELLGPDFKTGLLNESESIRPAVNILESKKEFGIEVAAPGLAREDFSINLEKEIITISASNTTDKSETTGKSVTTEDGKAEADHKEYTLREFGFSSFKRSFKLPKSVNGESISASYENGVLKIVLPKKEEAVEKPARHISIG
jgi:HSP20 family protein